MGTVLVTGAAGFIANRVARDLAAEHKVVAIDNVNDYYDVRLKEHRIEALDGIEFHRIDIENKAAMHPLFEENQFDAVVNLAARAGVRYSMENPHVYMTTNAHGSLNLLELMREFDVKKYVLASTSSETRGSRYLRNRPAIDRIPSSLRAGRAGNAVSPSNAGLLRDHHRFSLVAIE